MNCPNCEALIAVPEAESTAGDSSGTQPIVTAETHEVPPPDLISFPTEGATLSSGGGEWVGVSRLTIFLQGVLLAATAVVFFVAGTIVGRQSAPSGSRAERLGPAEVSGRVLYAAGRDRRPDSGAVVMVLPAGARPDVKLDAVGLRASDPRISDLHASLKTIRSWGGDYVRVDGKGRFRVRVPEGGSFFLLVLSAHANRGAARPDLKHLAQIGRFFFPAVDLLEDRAYHWEQLDLTGNSTLPDLILRQDSS